MKENILSNDLSNVWTDEKHRLYLDSLEMTFVNQLHNSVALNGYWQVEDQQYSNRDLPTHDHHNSLQQLMVQQEGIWQRINSKNNDPTLESTAESQFTGEIIHPVASSTVWHNGESHGLHQDSASRSEEKVARGTPVTSYGSIRSLDHFETSDQNFDGEDKPNCVLKTKKLKFGADSSKNDWVVPSGKRKTRNAFVGRQLFFQKQKPPGHG